MKLRFGDDNVLQGAGPGDKKMRQQLLPVPGTTE